MNTEMVSLPGTSRQAVVGTAQIRHGVGRLEGRLIVSAVTDRGRRQDLDTSACVFLALGLRDYINARS